MIVAWMLYGALVGALLYAAAWAADGAMGGSRTLTRWVWLLAVLLTAGLTMTSPLRSYLAVPNPGTAVEVGAIATTQDGPVAPPPGPLARLGQALGGVADQPGAALGALAARVPAWLDRLVGALWLGAAAAGLLALLWTSLRVRRSLRRWPAADVQGVRVRVAPAAGPAVVGLWSSHIVVPRWLLSLDPAAQRLILAHELEHRRSRDSLVLGMASAAAALLPWHPAVRLMLRRLRLAVELDCDARVLQQGVGRHRYGSLLIDLAGRCSGFPVGAPALADGTSHLERRLIAMKEPTRRPGALRAVLALTTLALGLMACEAQMPTAAEVDQMDAAAAEEAARRATILPAAEGQPLYYIDGVRVGPEVANSLEPEAIARISVLKGEAARRVSDHPAAADGIIRIVTKEAQAEGLLDEAAARAGHGDAAELPQRIRIETRGAEIAGGDFPGLVYIDGVRVDAEEMETLDPDRIESIEVVKGPAARLVSDDPAARHGIIRITTRDD